MLNPKPTRHWIVIVVASCLSLIAGAGCGEQIGDSCALSTDCDATGERICDVSSVDGYCTVLGCDVDTCPEEAVCVRFFSSTQTDRNCDPATEDRSRDDCPVDEFCTLAGHCALSNAESRYCMKTCDSNSDCREQYECRDLELMQQNGGEPLPVEGERRGENPTNFCAAAAAAS